MYFSQKSKGVRFLEEFPEYDLRNIIDDNFYIILQNLIGTSF